MTPGWLPRVGGWLPCCTEQVHITAQTGRDRYAAVIEITVFFGFVLLALFTGGFAYLESSFFGCVILAGATAVASTFQLRISTSPHSRHMFGLSAGLLGIALFNGSDLTLVAFWALGLALGWAVARRDVMVGLRVGGRSTLMGLVFLLVWTSLAEVVSFPATAAVATAAYILFSLAVLSTPQLVEGESPRAIIADFLPWRILLVFALNTALVIVVGAARAWTLLSPPESHVEISTVISLTLTAAVVSAAAMLRTARVARQRIDGVIDAALALPWPGDEDPIALMREYASRALRSGRIEVRTTPPNSRFEIGASFLDPAGEIHYLVARRKPGRSPFIDRDQQTLTAIAHIGQNDMRVRSETSGLLSEAHTDPLTGLPNYRAFQSALASAADYTAIAVAYIDVDDFKTVNDRHGHEIGNLVLQAVANRLARAVRPTDFVARVGGDEFVVILGEVADLAHAERIVARITRAVSPPIDLGGTVVMVNFSTGVSFSPGGRELDPLRLVEEADARMYSSRGRVSAATAPGGSTRSGGELGDATAAVRAVAETIDGQHLVAYYQPIVDNVLGEVIAYEALVRAKHPDFDGISPSLLVHEASRTGRLDMLTEQLLDKVVVDSARIRSLDPKLNDVHVNVEVDQLTARRILPRLADIVTEHPDLHLTLEMTENSLGRATDLILADLAALRGSGLIFALDDFGQAYSTMLSIVQYPIEILKVDRALVEVSSHGGKSQQVMRSLVLLSRKLGVTMVVEGVETVAERDWLAKLGVRYMQGFLFERPQPIEVVLETLERQGRHVPNATKPER